MVTVPVKKHLISVEEYDRMVKACVFRRGERLELIHGEIIEMTPIGPNHANHVDEVLDILRKRLGNRVRFRCQAPVHMGGFSEPEPDLLLLEPSRERYRKRHPRAEDVLLVIEVADSSLQIDREVKGPLYRGEGVREYWILNLVDRCLEVHRLDEPTRTLRPGERIAPLAFPDLEFQISELLV